MATTKNNVANIIARRAGTGYTYIAIMKDGTEQVVRAKSNNLYEAAHLHGCNVNSGKPAGLPSTVSFGKKSSYPEDLVKSYPVSLVEDAPKAKAPAKAKKEAPAKAAPAPVKEVKVPAKRVPKANSYKNLAANRFTASKVENPVYAMWELCNANVDKSRKQVIELAVAKGISFYTARTQYQLWLTAYRNSN